MRDWTGTAHTLQAKSVLAASLLRTFNATLRLQADYSPFTAIVPLETGQAFFFLRRLPDADLSLGRTPIPEFPLVWWLLSARDTQRRLCVLRPITITQTLPIRYSKEVVIASKMVWSWWERKLRIVNVHARRAAEFHSLAEEWTTIPKQIKRTENNAAELKHELTFHEDYTARQRW